MAAQNGETFQIPKTMKAIRYNKIKDWSLVEMPVPTPKPHEVLVKSNSLSILQHHRATSQLTNYALQSNPAASAAPTCTSTTATSTLACPS